MKVKQDKKKEYGWQDLNSWLDAIQKESIGGQNKENIRQL